MWRSDLGAEYVCFADLPDHGNGFWTRPRQGRMRASRVGFESKFVMANLNVAVAASPLEAATALMPARKVASGRTAQCRD